MASIRAGILLLVSAVALLLGAAVAHAAPPSFSVSRSEAAKGEEVPFKITGTEAWSEYTLTVDGQLVARGTDPAGNGIDDKFTMPDLGSSDKDVTVEARVTQPSSPDPFIGTTTMRYLLFPAPVVSPTPEPQPEPVALEAVPVAQVAPLPSKRITPTPPRTKRTKAKVTPQTKKSPSDDKQTSGGSGSVPTSTPAPAASTPSSNSGGASARSKSRAPSAGTQAPSGPTGAGGVGPPAVQPPTGGGLGSAAPISGIATVGSGGFPTFLLVMLVVALALLTLVAMVAAARRLVGIDWRRFVPAAGPADDEVRLGALSRAARSGGEVQRAIAARKASRTEGRAS